jgi:hypothetical protein
MYTRKLKKEQRAAHTGASTAAHSTHRGIHISKVSKATQRQSHTEAARDETGALTERDSTEIQLGEYKDAGSAVALTSPPRIYLVKSFALKI